VTYHERLRELDQILEHHLDALNQLARMDRDQLAKPVCSNGWTIAQVIDHLLLGQEPAVKLFLQTLEEAPALANDRELNYNLFEKGLLSIMGPKPFVKVPVPAMFRPNHPADIEGHLTRLEANLRGFRQVVESAKTKDLAQPKVASPANQKLKMSAIGYLDAMIRHFQYHWSQVEAARRKLDR
jgi:hypothetical protein